jgi:hypothetical protein
MLAHESQVSPRYKGRPYWNSFSFFTLGVGQGVELAATVYGVGSPLGKVAVAGGFKQRIELVKASTWQPTVAYGSMFPVSASHPNVGVWTYGVSSVRLPTTRTRLTAGASYGSGLIFGYPTVHAVGGLEQPLSKRIILIADYFSGRHDLGALITAVQVNVTPAFIVIAGVKTPTNPDRAGPMAGLVEITYELPVFGDHAAPPHQVARGPSGFLRPE